MEGVHTGNMFTAIFDLQQVLARFLGLDAQCEGAVTVVEQLAVGHLSIKPHGVTIMTLRPNSTHQYVLWWLVLFLYLLWPVALRGELAGAGATSVDRRLDLTTHDSHLQTLA